MRARQLSRNELRDANCEWVANAAWWSFRFLGGPSETPFRLNVSLCVFCGEIVVNHYEAFGVYLRTAERHLSQYTEL